MEICLTEKPLNAAACQQDVQRRRMVGKAAKGNFVVSNLCFHRGPLPNDRSMVSAGAEALIKSRCRDRKDWNLRAKPGTWPEDRAFRGVIFSTSGRHAGLPSPIAPRYPLP
ncbi:MAG: hypothetical protein J0H60_07160, partial [Rhizobiales bacterium]|nr:hypothetical protein [Hyphomicrobiales bacterium]